MPTVISTAAGSPSAPSEQVPARKYRQEQVVSGSHSDVVLRAEGISVVYQTPRGAAHAVSDVSFDLRAGETLGIAGASGCGTSSLARAVLQLPRPTSGSVYYRGENLVRLSPGRMRSLRPELQMVFQDPMSSLNPRKTILQSLSEPLRITKVVKSERRTRVHEILDAVGLDPYRHGDARPGQLSGGQCQRAAIARALLSGARVLICDEAVSALDVSLRATVLNLINELKAEFGFSVMFIAHDLAVVKNVSDRILVMYLGQICEQAPADELYESPHHPYSDALMSVVPEADPQKPLPGNSLTGDLPSPLNPPEGCRFRSRCARADNSCLQRPEMLPLGSSAHLVA